MNPSDFTLKQKLHEILKYEIHKIFEVQKSVQIDQTNYLFRVF